MDVEGRNAVLQVSLSQFAIVDGMKKLGTALIALCIITVAFAGCLTLDSSQMGFDSDSVSAPAIVNADVVTIPKPQTLIPPGTGVCLTWNWNITEDIYAGYGGALRLTVNNNDNNGKYYVYSFGLRWDTDQSTFRNCSVYIPPGQSAQLGLLTFNAPSEEGIHSYRTVLKIASWNHCTKAWYDHGEVISEKWRSVVVKSLGNSCEYRVEHNFRPYYNDVNSRVNYGATSEAIEEIKNAQPGEYNTLQVAEAYEWVRNNIAYKSDGDVDYWQSAEETLELRTGDCEDQAILLASIIGALGGNARVNIIQSHAFPTVFVGTTSQDISDVRCSIASYYGLGPNELNVAYMEDDMGYWLVIDTTGFPYAGGIPAQSVPTSASGDWTIKSDYIYPIDATGKTSGFFFGLF